MNESEHIDVDAIKAKTIGKWPGIIDQLGIGIRKDGKHSPCPMCGGKDRFRFDDKDGQGTWICNQCGAGDGWALLQTVLNIDFLEAVKQVARTVGHVEMTAQPDRPDPAIRLREMWKASVPLNPQVRNYLRARGLTLEPGNIRYCEKCFDPDTCKEYPAMVAVVHNGEAKPVTMHRTYLDGNKKADIESPKKLMPGIEKLNNVSVRLFKIEGDTLGVAEGIETAIAATQLFNIPTWAAINSTLLTTWEPPEGCKKIVIFGDNDKNFTGHKASYILANKLFLKGFTVDVQIPDAPGDWNDVLLKHKEG